MICGKSLARTNVSQIVVVCARTTRRHDVTISVGGEFLDLQPLGGTRFEMRLPHSRAIGVDDSGAEMASLVSSGSTRAVPFP